MQFFLLVSAAAMRIWWADRSNFVCTNCPQSEAIVCVQFEYQGQSIYQDELLSHCSAKSENRS